MKLMFMRLELVVIQNFGWDKSVSHGGTKVGQCHGCAFVFWNKSWRQTAPKFASTGSKVVRKLRLNSNALTRFMARNANVSPFASDIPSDFMHREIILEKSGRLGGAGQWEFLKILFLAFFYSLGFFLDFQNVFLDFFNPDRKFQGYFIQK